MRGGPIIAGVFLERIDERVDGRGGRGGGSHRLWWRCSAKGILISPSF